MKYLLILEAVLVANGVMEPALVQKGISFLLQSVKLGELHHLFVDPNKTTFVVCHEVAHLTLDDSKRFANGETVAISLAVLILEAILI